MCTTDKNKHKNKNEELTALTKKKKKKGKQKSIGLGYDHSHSFVPGTVIHLPLSKTSLSTLFITSPDWPRQRE